MNTAIIIATLQECRAIYQELASKPLYLPTPEAVSVLKRFWNYFTQGCLEEEQLLEAAGMNLTEFAYLVGYIDSSVSGLSDRPYSSASTIAEAEADFIEFGKSSESAWL